MPRTLGPRRVDEPIMYVLLGHVDDALDVTRDVVDKLSQSNRVVQDQIVVTRSNGCVQIQNEPLDDALLIRISNRHYELL